MRSRRRYIAFEVEGGGTDRYELLKMIEHSIRVNCPSIDRTALKLILYENGSRRGLFRCGHRQVEELKTSISSAGKIGGGKFSLRILGVSGTIRAARRKFFAQSYKNKELNTLLPYGL